MRDQRAFLRGSLLLLTFAATGCSKKSAAPTAPSATASSPASATSAIAPPIVIHPPVTKPACRALAVSGQVTVGDQVIKTSALLDGASWVDLAPGATLALRHTITSRELKIVGPAHALPCRSGAEQVLLASGRVSTSANLGVRPGAEVLIATPFGTVRYGDAALDVDVGPHGLDLHVKEGEAWLEPESAAKKPFKNPLGGHGHASLPNSGSTPSTLVDRCQAAAQHADESARRVLSNAPDAGSLGERAAAQVRDRAAARRACAMAAAAVGSVTEPAERQQLWASLIRWEGLWQSVPHPGPTPAP